MEFGHTVKWDSDQLIEIAAGTPHFRQSSWGLLNGERCLRPQDWDDLGRGRLPLGDHRHEQRSQIEKLLGDVGANVLQLRAVDGGLVRLRPLNASCWSRE